MKQKEMMPVPVPEVPLDAEEHPADPSEGEDVAEEFVEIVLATDYGNFFARWLQKQGVVHSIIEQKSYVVESDVANYFSSIDLGLVQEYLLRTGLHRDVVRLLIHLVRNVLRHPQYAESPSLGLPQEPIDSSRHIAHGLLWRSIGNSMNPGVVMAMIQTGRMLGKNDPDLADVRSFRSTSLPNWSRSSRMSMSTVLEDGEQELEIVPQRRLAAFGQDDLLDAVQVDLPGVTQFGHALDDLVPLGFDAVGVDR